MRQLTGVVISDKMSKTIVVQVNRLKKHPTYQKYYRISKKFKAHDETGAYHQGDTVIIRETRPLSKEKRWIAVELVKQFSGAESKELETARTEPAEEGKDN